MYMNLKLEMKKRHLNQQHLSSCLKLSANTITSRMTCRTYFSRDEQEQLLASLFANCDVAYLFHIWNPDLSGLYHVKNL